MTDDFWRDTTPLRAPQPREPRRLAWRWVALLVIWGVVVLGAVFGPIVWLAATYGCDDGDLAYARQLAKSEELDVAPPGAQPVGGRDTACEDDDEMAMASQDYRRGELSHEAVLAFYERSLAAAGWTPSTEVEGPGCWNHQVGDRRLSLSLHQHEAPDRFTVELSSARRGAGGGWCS